MSSFGSTGLPLRIATVGGGSEVGGRCGPQHQKHVIQKDICLLLSDVRQIVAIPPRVAELEARSLSAGPETPLCAAGASLLQCNDAAFLSANGAPRASCPASHWTYSNSSYDPEHAIPIGRMLEEYRYVYYEEPCEFDALGDTRKVRNALSIPVALGEQEFSEWRFRLVYREPRLRHRAA